MRNPWKKHSPDNRENQQRVEQAEKKAERQLVRANELSHEADKVAAGLRTARLRNHFGENIAASFELRHRRFPWTR